jgi:hypothetical protein
MSPDSRGRLGRPELLARLLTALVVLTGLHAPAWGQQVVELQNLRFLDERSGQLTPIEPLGSGQDFSVGLRGSLLAEFSFQSDLVDERGRYFSAPMRLYWRIGYGDGSFVAVRAMPDVPGAEWNGVDTEVLVFVTSLDVDSGLAGGSLNIPVGGHAQAPGQGAFPMLPGGGMSLSVVVGWDERMTLAGDGRPEDFVASAETSFETSWPGVWIGLERPAGHPRVGDAQTQFVLLLDRPVDRERRFTIEAQPPGIARVLTREVTFTPQDDIWGQVVLVRADDLGQFALNVHEGETLVARSAIQTVVQRPVIASVLDPEFALAQPSGGEPAGPGSIDPAGLFQKCVPARISDHATNPTVERCGPCKKEPHADDPCTSEGGGGVNDFKSARCRFSLFSRCRLKSKTHTMDVYTFASKVRRPCTSVTLGGSVLLGAGVASAAMTVYRSATCCIYEADAGAPPVQRSILECD